MKDIECTLAWRASFHSELIDEAKRMCTSGDLDSGNPDRRYFLCFYEGQIHVYSSDSGERQVVQALPAATGTAAEYACRR